MYKEKKEYNTPIDLLQAIQSYNTKTFPAIDSINEYIKDKSITIITINSVGNEYIRRDLTREGAIPLSFNVS